MGSAECSPRYSEGETLNTPEPLSLFDYHMECNVLSGLMVISSLYDSVSGELSEQLFYFEKHRLIFRGIKALADKGGAIDGTLVLDWITNHGFAETVGGEEYIMQIVQNSVASLHNTPSYIGVIADLHTRRKAIEALSEALRTVRDDRDTPAGDVIASASTKMLKATDQGLKSDEFIDTKTAILRMEESIQAGELDGTPTGFFELDAKIGGLSGSQFIVIGGRPGMGKSVLASNIATHIMYKKRLPALYFSLEMSEIDLTVRILCNHANVDLAKAKSNDRNAEELASYQRATLDWAQQPFFIDPAQEIPIDRIRNKARKIHREHGGLSAVVVDYIQLVKAHGKGNRTLEIDAITQSLKAMAKELDCPVLGLAQLSRTLEGRADKRPIMSDLRESGSIEQDADVILFIYRDEVYTKEKSKFKGFAEIIIGKQRQGEVGASVMLAFNGAKCRFENRMGSGVMDYSDYGDDQ